MINQNKLHLVNIHEINKRLTLRHKLKYIILSINIRVTLSNSI